MADGELFYIISNGVRLTGMPAWEEEDSPEEIWDLVSFIRRLPQRTPEELKEMKQSSLMPELPGRMLLDREAYLAVQTIYYPGFTFGGIRMGILAAERHTPGGATRPALLLY